MRIKNSDYGKITVITFFLVGIISNVNEFNKIGLLLSIIQGILALVCIIYGGLWFANFFTKSKHESLPKDFKFSEKQISEIKKAMGNDK
jgi:hypothetical protein